MYSFLIATVRQAVPGARLFVARLGSLTPIRRWRAGFFAIFNDSITLYLAFTDV